MANTDSSTECADKTLSPSASSRRPGQKQRTVSAKEALMTIITLPPFGEAKCPFNWLLRGLDEVKTALMAAGIGRVTDNGRYLHILYPI